MALDLTSLSRCKAVSYQGRDKARRRFLKISLAMAWASGCDAGPAAAAHATGDAVFDQFLATSVFLTGNADLDTDLAKNFAVALNDQNPGFYTALNNLSTTLRFLKPMDIDDFDLNMMAQNNQNCARVIIAAWYSGVVGTAANAVVVSFEDALVYDVLSDALTVQSFCDGGPAAWTNAPPPAPMAAPGLQKNLRFR